MSRLAGTVTSDTSVHLRRVIVLCLLVALGWGCAGASAHETRMAFLDIRQTSADDYSLALKIPVTGRTAWPIEAALPPECSGAPPIQRHMTGNLLVERTFRCTGGSHELILRGLEGGFVDVLVRVEDRHGGLRTFVAPAATGRIPLAAGESTIGSRILLGVEHMLAGADHLLFVAGLLLLVRGGRRVVLSITAFTLAHSVTLGAAVLGLVEVPISPVEACIALSIVYLAYAVCLERGWYSAGGAKAGHPPGIAFAFGLLHGFGFAGALAETGLPQGSLITTLFLFNVGIELGQLAFAAFVWLLLAFIDRLSASASARQRFEIAAAYGMGGIGVYWVIERVAGF